MNALLALAIALHLGLADTVRVRNPQFFRANELLERRLPGSSPRVRFEWEEVPGAVAYLLQGSWTDVRTWAVRSREYRVEPPIEGDRPEHEVRFEVALPKGAHSWRVVALFGPTESGDFAHPGHVAFDLE